MGGPAPGRGYKELVIDGRLRYVRPGTARPERSLADEVRSGLARPPRSLSPRFFYDKRGSELFERICETPEYYLTRTEASILARAGPEIPGLLGGPCRLVELGSGSSTKTRLLLGPLCEAQEATEYVPVDISDILEESSELLLRDYASLSITGVIDTYEGGLEFLRGRGGRSLVAFLGSSLGNFGPGEGARFLGSVRAAMGPGDSLLLGLDLVKGAAVLEAAYDDARGATAEFNLNMLERINSELGADFDLGRFEHRSVYNAAERRVEMYIRSLREQQVSIPGSDLDIALGEGELIHTEYSHKYELDGIPGMLGAAGLGVERTWTDGGDNYALVLASPA